MQIEKKGLSLSNVIFRLFCHKSPPFHCLSPKHEMMKDPERDDIWRCLRNFELNTCAYLFSDLPPPVTMSDMENFHLARNDFDACTRNTFKNLWQDGEVFADVTLACRDKQLKAHKVLDHTLLMLGPNFFSGDLISLFALFPTSSDKQPSSPPTCLPQRHIWPWPRGDCWFHLSGPEILRKLKFPKKGAGRVCSANLHCCSCC